MSSVDRPLKGRMMGYFTKRYHPPGTSPGTLTRPAAPPAVPLRISLVDYDENDFTELSDITAEACRPYLESPAITWIHLQGDPDPAVVRQIGELFALHPLALEDVVNTGQRPKTDSYTDQLFVVLSHPLVENDRARTEQISLFLGRNVVISFHQGAHDPFEPVRKRLRERAAGNIRTRGADYLLYSLIDVVIDLAFPVLEWFGAELEGLEEQLLEKPTNECLRRLHEMKRETLLLRRMLWPERDVLSELLRDGAHLISDNTKVYLRDCYDHVVQTMDLLETYREMATSMLDIYLSSISYRLNDTIRVLTVIATIFMPLTFIAGVYGMNFEHPRSPWAMPELHWYYGYPLVWLAMLGVAGGMLYWFKRRGWF